MNGLIGAYAAPVSPVSRPGAKSASLLPAGPASRRGHGATCVPTIAACERRRLAAIRQVTPTWPAVRLCRVHGRKSGRRPRRREVGSRLTAIRQGMARPCPRRPRVATWARGDGAAWPRSAGDGPCFQTERPPASRRGHGAMPPGRDPADAAPSSPGGARRRDVARGRRLAVEWSPGRDPARDGPSQSPDSHGTPRRRDVGTGPLGRDPAGDGRRAPASRRGHGGDRRPAAIRQVLAAVPAPRPDDRPCRVHGRKSRLCCQWPGRRDASAPPRSGR
jgi:hypothetical protein